MSPSAKAAQTHQELPFASYRSKLPRFSEKNDAPETVGPGSYVPLEYLRELATKQSCKSALVARSKGQARSAAQKLGQLIDLKTLIDN